MSATRHAHARDLARVPLFASLSEGALQELAGDAAPLELEPGAYLFHAGEPAASVYIVAQGELEVLLPAASGRDATRVNQVGPGAVIGELAVLREERRSASIRAHTAALVLSISSARFHRLMRDWPSVALAIARHAAERLVHVERRAHAATRADLWLGARDRVITPEFVSALARAAASYLPTPEQRGPLVVFGGAARGDDAEHGIEHRACPDADPGQTLGPAVQDARARAALVLVCAPGAELGGLVEQCSGVVWHDAWPGAPLPREARQIELASAGEPSASRVKFASQSGAHEVAPRCARLLLGRAIGLALGGGAALGMAHLGVLTYLEEQQIPVDFISGTSFGAVAGGVYAAGGIEPLMRRATTMTRARDWLWLLEHRVFTTGVMSGERMRRFLAEMLAVHHSAELFTPFAATAFNVEDGEEVTLSRGSLTDNIFASMAIPGLIEPPCVEIAPGVARRLVDGGMIDQVPVEAARRLGAHRVIGVNVLARPASEPGAPGLRRYLPSLPGLSRAKLLAQAQFMSMIRAGERGVYAADVPLTPATRGVGFHEFWKGPELIECGRRAAADMARELSSLIERRAP